MFQKIWRLFRKAIPDLFIAGILLMILLARLFPGIGSKGSIIELSLVIKFGISLLFFFYGLKLNPARLRHDLGNWRLHLVIQATTFIVFPLLLLIFYPFFKGTDQQILWMSVFFLAALPSTVSSSVVMVSIAGGNITGAIFNASISGIIGILITPAWMGLFLDTQSTGFDFGPVVRDLALQVLLPLMIGLTLHRFWGEWANRNRKRISYFDKAVILTIVYRSFSDSFINGIFESIPGYALLLLSTGVIILFLLIFHGTRFVTKLLHFNREDSITVLFCGSKKSLVHGSVMVGVLFAGSTLGSLFLVPVMIYHAFQLFYIGIVAGNYSRQIETRR